MMISLVRASHPLLAAVVLAGCVSARSVSLAAPPGGALPAATPASAPPAAATVLWQERFDGPSLSWVAPFGHSEQQVASVYSLAGEAGASFLRAHHDARPDTPRRVRAINYGKLFDADPPPLERVAALRWRWRARQHAAVGVDPWLDLAASVYVIIRNPSLLHGGKGFKFGWLASHGPSETFQMGLAQIEMRSDPAGSDWKQEKVDLCALYRKLFGPCEGEHVHYVGVLTDADGTESIAEGDYADLTLDRVQ